MKTKLWWKWQYVPSTFCVLLNRLCTIPFLPLRAFSLSSHLNVPILTTLVIYPWPSFFWGSCLCEFTRAALTKQYILTGLNNSSLFFSQFWKLEVHNQGVSGVASFWWLQRRIWIRPLSLVWRRLCSSRLLVCVQISPFQNEDARETEIGPSKEFILTWSPLSRLSPNKVTFWSSRT